MRRRASAVAFAAPLIPLLSGCSLLALPFQQLTPQPSVAPLGIGSCLDGMNGADSDRTAVVACDRPHLFEVTAIEEWPGMADALAAADDAGALWDEIHLVHGGSDAADTYGEWASRACNEAGQRAIGISDVEVDGHTASELWLWVGAMYGVDLSLGSRAEFVAGDHRTVCALAWYNAGQTPERAEGSEFDLIIAPGLSPDRRECWDSDYYSVSCSRPHAAQTVLGFDGLIAYGEELIARVAGGDWSVDDADTTDYFCEDLLLQTLPPTANMDGLGYYAETYSGTGWDAFEGTVDPDESYPFVCLVVGLEQGDLIEGDVFDGDAKIHAGSGAAASA